MRGSPDHSVAVVPVTGFPRLTDYLFNAPGGAQVTFEFCDDAWHPLQAAATVTFPAALNVPVSFAAFTCSSANATIGAVYIDSTNGQRFVVTSTIAGGTTLACMAQGTAPGASGTLTKFSGTGDATITYSAVVYQLIPAGATRAHCYTSALVYWNMGALNPYAPAVAQIPGSSEFDLGVFE